MLKGKEVVNIHHKAPFFKRTGLVLTEHNNTCLVSYGNVARMQEAHNLREFVPC